MNLRPFQIEINRHPPFIGLFESSSAALDAFHALAAAEARIGNGFRLAIQPYRPEGEGNACIERESFAASLPEGGEGAGSVEPADRPVDAAVSNNDRRSVRAAWPGIALAGSSGRDMHVEIDGGAPVSTLFIRRLRLAFKKRFAKKPNPGWRSPAHPVQVKPTRRCCSPKASADASLCSIPNTAQPLYMRMYSISMC